MKLPYNKILVTGADGFIGSHLSEALVRHGYDVRAFVMYNSFNSWGWLEHIEPEIKKAMEIVAGDIRDPQCIKRAMTGCGTVCHLAALIAIPYSYDAPDAYLDTNIKGTLNILLAARELAVERIIHTSTSEVYGTARFVPITEEHPLHAQSPYAASKIGADQLALSFHHSFSMPISILRPFNTYGPRQSARAVIPTIITQIAAGRRTLQLGALNPTRDFNFIEDTVRGFILALTSPQAIGEVVNIGSNFEISIRETVQTIAEIMDVDVSIESDQRRMRPTNSEVDRLWANNAKAKKLLNWEPHYGGRDGFKRGLKETVAWFQSPENLCRYRPDKYTV